MKDRSLHPGGFNSLQDAAANLKIEADMLIEAMRLKRITDLGLVAKVFDRCYDDFVLIAATSCGTPLAHITLIDEATQYIKSRFGPPLDGPLECDRAEAICNITIQHPETITIIPDARVDERTKRSIWVTSNSLRFYAGAPLTTDDGLALGTLCVFDPDHEHDLTSQQTEIMQALSRLIVNLLTRRI